MKKSLINGGLMAIALVLGLPAGNAEAQDFSNAYITPRLLYSFQSGDMSSANYNIGGSRGSVFGGSKDDKVLGFGISAGLDLEYAYNYPIRVELEYAYHGMGEYEKHAGPLRVGTDIYSASQRFKVKTHTFMVNGFYDIPTNGPLNPYIGGGIGMSYMRTKYRTVGDVNGFSAKHSNAVRDWNFAWNLGGGLSYQINEVVALDLGYRYYDFGKVEAERMYVPTANYNGKPSIDIDAHELSVGLRFASF